MSKRDDGKRDDSGIIKRDLIKVLDFVNGGTLECKHPISLIIIMAFAVASVGYVESIDRDRIRKLFDVVIDGFDPDEHARGV